MSGQADSLTYLGGLGAHIEPEHAGIAAIRWDQGGQHTHCGGFTGTIGTEQAVNTARPNAQIYAVHRTGFTEMFAQACYFNGQLRGVHRRAISLQGWKCPSYTPYCDGKVACTQLLQASPAFPVAAAHSLFSCHYRRA